MPRKSLFENKDERMEMSTSECNHELEKLVDSYIVNKEKEKEYKDLASTENTQIKTLMNEFNISKFTSGLGSVSLSERVNEDFIEDKLIEFLKTHNCGDDIIKTKEYVDFDALESAIYNERIPADVIREMSSCKERKVTQVLRIKKKGDK